MGPDIPQDTKAGFPMTLKEAITLFGYHQRSNLKSRTVRSYQPLLQQFEAEFGERSFDSIGSDEIFQFLEDALDRGGRKWLFTIGFTSSLN